MDTTHNTFWTTRFEGLADHPYTMGPVFEIGLSQTPVYEVAFANGVVALIRQQDGMVEAVKVPKARKGDFDLHVWGISHETKWGKIHKGNGLVWTGRKTWTSMKCEWCLEQYCKGL